jgi:integrase
MANLVNSNYSQKLNTAKGGINGRASSSKFTVRFLHRRKTGKQSTQTNECWVYMELQFGKQRKFFSIGISCNHGDLNQKTLEIAGDYQKTILIQHYKMEAIKLYTELTLTERAIDLDLIKSAVLGSGKVGIPTIQQAIDLLYTEIETSYNLGEIAKGTLKKIKGWTKHLNQFTNEKLGRNARIESVTPHDIKAFVLWLKTDKKISHNTTQMISGHFNRVMVFCLENQWIIRNPFLNYKRKFETKKVEALSETEIGKIEQLNLIGDSVLERAKDVFLFMIYTGLSYTDCHSLKAHHIVETKDSDFFISKPRDKTKSLQTVYLIEKALIILEKYKTDPYCNKYQFLVPIISNQKINNHLKTIQRFSGIKKNLTCKISRSTYSSILYNANLSEKAMKYTMGHSRIEMTLKHYVKQDQEGIVKDLKEAFSRTKISSLNYGN